ncbi:MAG TPA: phosphoenolpyruvate--protein phosphotransferase [Anaerolineae bacterium]|nr:phosphoenolpyruvate--protein phosphotransferase [Anaerolineae bacterium]
MVGIVVVAHSAKIAEGVLEMARQMVGTAVPLAAAGGIDDPENPIGTDAIKILAAIQSVYSDDGVVVLMDLGSALLSAETALELLPPAEAAQVHLCAAPLVEGALAAVVQASLGSSTAAVMGEALGALAAKQAQLGVAQGEEGGGEMAVSAKGQSISLTVRNKLGLHARPAARFVRTANQFDAEITVRKGKLAANAKSINQVATLGVRQGETVKITAVGPEAEQALAALQALADDNFGDVDEVAAPDVEIGDQKLEIVEGALAGIAGSPGIAIGPAAHYRPTLPQVTEREVTDVAGEWVRLQTAVTAAIQEIEQIRETAVRQMGQSEADIFAAHELILKDPALLEDAHQRILTRKINAEAAWQAAYEAVAARYAAIEDEYMRARAADVRDVGQRALRHLLGVTHPTFTLAQPAILLAEDLTPSDTAQLDPALALGIATERGGATSHTAILARGLGIPAVVGVGPALAAIADDQMIALDGRTGQLWPDPDKKTLARLKKEQAEWQAERQKAQRLSREDAVTADGRRIEVAANIGSPQEAAIALQYGAEGVGLFRTEFLFMERDSAPTEEEQLAAYQKAAEVMGERPLIIRTLDVGGDKPLRYLDLGREDNPFLGWRGIRFCLDRPDIFLPQLRAILRAGAAGNVKLMFPMIGTLAELRAAKEMMAQAKEELRQAKLPFAEKMDVGLMIEVPSAVAVADQLAREADFFSIGTNDLTQYLLAADRGNRKVADLVNALHPAVLRMVRQTAVAAHEAGIWVGMCGELAGNALAAPLLLGLGLDELSMASPAIPAVKTAVRQTTMAQAEELARVAVGLESGTAVAEFLRKEIGD